MHAHDTPCFTRLDPCRPSDAARRRAPDPNRPSKAARGPADRSSGRARRGRTGDVMGYATRAEDPQFATAPHAWALRRGGDRLELQMRAGDGVYQLRALLNGAITVNQACRSLHEALVTAERLRAEFRAQGWEPASEPAQ